MKEGETTNDLFAFLTTEPNKLVGAIHPKAMPVILTTPEEIDFWMDAPAEEALKLQRPLGSARAAVTRYRKHRRERTAKRAKFGLASSMCSVLSNARRSSRRFAPRSAPSTIHDIRTVPANEGVAEVGLEPIEAPLRRGGLSSV